MSGLAEMLVRLRAEKSDLLRQLNGEVPATAPLLRRRIGEIDEIVAAIEAVLDDR